MFKCAYGEQCDIPKDEHNQCFQIFHSNDILSNSGNRIKARSQIVVCQLNRGYLPNVTEED